MDLNKKIGDSSEFSQHSANPEERFLVGMFSQITERLKQKYNYSSEELLNLGSNDLLVPVSVFAGKLSPAEALTKFLKENNDKQYYYLMLMEKFLALLHSIKKTSNNRKKLKHLITHFKMIALKVKEAIQRLPENLRSVFVLYEIEEMKYKEISKALDLPVNSVKVYLLRARKKLQEELKDYARQEA